MDVAIDTELTRALLGAARSKAPSQGFTHTFYRYPGRFSPEFARAAIKLFSKPGDVILDPFMGSGTTLVEALIAGRHSIGSDISSLANFVTRVKTSILEQSVLDEIQEWYKTAQANLNIWRPAVRQQAWVNRGYQKYLPWRIRKLIELVLDEVFRLTRQEQRNFVRCALLRTAQWALDCTKTFPSASEFRSKFGQTLQGQIDGVTHLREAVERLPHKERPCVLSFNTSALKLYSEYWSGQINKKPTLIVTSPPYPNVRVLYHRWQIKGRRQTPAPFWIAGQMDGHGEKFYTMGGRSLKGVNDYFKTIEESYAHIHSLLEEGAIVIQLVAFSDAEQQLPRYLKAMNNAGYAEIEVGGEGEGLDGRVWRQVPLRKWYASLKGNLPSSREFLLIHKKFGRLSKPPVG